ncbi:glucans biosynthesis glucosyltransferase MdoH [Sphingomonas nostoxanthinifaciens]|uniref:glucans biosynthesis glucosyltransferase MdoH n=1 Tax=Sphingomonas nostoxanthinifaciens TaxID=2872652 RepID=UPI001CC1EB81|nr:glucans biosynthesis glucosyltransferase MdoH [Sphingomonas nostoxanthinifaciens]UAK23428.1 glucans biosynthesis glucosyltransferase MdoH [Sphingomonas nostoxanthinifaciens]
MSYTAWGTEADLPAEQPLAMPIQDFGQAPAARAGRLRQTPDGRRAFLILGSAIIGLVASCGIARPLALDGFDVIDLAATLLCLALFAWIAFGFLNAVAGLVTLLTARRAPDGDQLVLPRSPTAVLIPVYNEDMGQVEDRIERMMRSLDKVGAATLFDFFILSDSHRDAETVERTAAHRLRDLGLGAVYYRRRTFNEARKPGNIGDWVRRFGGGYPAMIVLDADSLMTGETMVRLAAGMEAEPSLGLIQTNPLLTGGKTLFARWQQFATAFYGPIASAGLAWWSGDEATFWGHNAILRTAAFAQSCGLPKLAGPEPLGGHIMSHDMVEAALMRRRGWGARLMLLDAGSYEECPPTLVDHGVRDRRWAQGNLQHLRLLDTPGMHWINRLQLLMGASAYITSPLWLLALTLGLFQAVRTGTPMADLGTPVWLIALTVVLLFGTRLLAVIWAAHDARLVRMMGGWRRIFLGIAAEIPLSIITAPIMMISQSIAIAEILGGRPSGWKPQRRDADGLSLAETFDHYRWHMLAGLIFWTMALSEVGGALWELPVALGLLGAPFIASFTSRIDVGDRAARWGIFSADPRSAIVDAPVVVELKPRFTPGSKLAA